MTLDVCDMLKGVCFQIVSFSSLPSGYEIAAWQDKMSLSLVVAIKAPGHVVFEAFRESVTSALVVRASQARAEHHR